ncbi:hypothetical protein V2G26_002868 [Clonostachys chloroleuca]
MGWRGAGGGGVSLIGVFYFFGSALQVPRKHLLLCGFGSYSAFWLAFGVTLQQLILLARLGPQKPQAWHNLNPRTGAWRETVGRPPESSPSFITCLAGISYSPNSQSLDVPSSLPVGGLSTKIKKAIDGEKDREEVRVED